MHKSARHKLATWNAGLKTQLDPVRRAPLFKKQLSIENGLSALPSEGWKAMKPNMYGPPVAVHANRYL